MGKTALCAVNGFKMVERLSLRDDWKEAELPPIFVVSLSVFRSNDSLSTWSWFL